MGASAHQAQYTAGQNKTSSAQGKTKTVSVFSSVEDMLRSTEFPPSKICNKTDDLTYKQSL